MLHARAPSFRNRAALVLLSLECPHPIAAVTCDRSLRGGPTPLNSVSFSSEGQSPRWAPRRVKSSLLTSLCSWRLWGRMCFLSSSSFPRRPRSLAPAPSSVFRASNGQQSLRSHHYDLLSASILLGPCGYMAPAPW